MHGSRCTQRARTGRAPPPAALTAAPRAPPQVAEALLLAEADVFVHGLSRFASVVRLLCERCVASFHVRSLQPELELALTPEVDLRNGDVLTAPYL